MKNIEILREYLKLVAIVLFVIAGFLLFIVPAEVSEGYCGSQKRILTDREYTRVALRKLHGQIKLEEDEKKSIDDFYKNREDCCVVTRPAKQSALITRLLGFDDPVVVRVIFEMKNESENDKSQRFYQEFVEIGVCGEYRYSYGENL